MSFGPFPTPDIPPSLSLALATLRVCKDASNNHAAFTLRRRMAVLILFIRRFERGIAHTFAVPNHPPRGRHIFEIKEPGFWKQWYREHTAR